MLEQANILYEKAKDEESIEACVEFLNFCYENFTTITNDQINDDQINYQVAKVYQILGKEYASSVSIDEKVKNIPYFKLKCISYFNECLENRKLQAHIGIATFYQKQGYYVNALYHFKEYERTILQGRKTKEVEQLLEKNILIMEEQEAQYEVELKFFDPEKIKSDQKDRVEKYTKHLLDSRTKSSCDNQFSIHGMPARRVIKGECSALEKFVEQKMLLKLPVDKGGYIDRPYESGIDIIEEIYVSDAKEGLRTQILIQYVALVDGVTKNIHPNHWGDCKILDICKHSDYKHIYDEIIKKVTNENPKKEKDLAEHMLTFCQKGKALSLEDLKKICDGSIPDAEITEHLHKLRRVFYLYFVKEVSRRKGPIHPDINHQRVPWACAQARALKCVIDGTSRMVDIFYGKYGAVTDTNIASNLGKAREKITKINKECLSSGCESLHLRYKKDLLFVYGAPSDSDNSEDDANGMKKAFEKKDKDLKHPAKKHKPCSKI